MKKETIIEIYTRFKNGDSHYLSIPELLYLTEKLKTDDTIISKYISFNPFYRHKDFLLEIDERLLYLERRNEITEENLEEFYEKLMVKEKGCEVYNVDLEKRCFLIQTGDKNGYIKTLEKMVSYLDVLMPYILQRLKDEFNLNETDLLYGNVCFETYYE